MPFEILIKRKGVLIKNGNKPPTVEDAHEPITWKLGQKRPCPNGDPWLLIASGKELDFIRLHFENIPMTLGAEKCMWKGEMAIFIFDNLIFIE